MASKRNMTKWAMMVAAALILGLVFGTSGSSVTVQAQGDEPSYAGADTVWEKVDLSEEDLDSLSGGTYIIVNENSGYAVQARKITYEKSTDRTIYALSGEYVGNGDYLTISSGATVNKWKFTSTDDGWTVSSGDFYLKINTQENVALESLGTLKLTVVDGYLHLYILENKDSYSGGDLQTAESGKYAVELNWYTTEGLFGAWHTPSAANITQFSDKNDKMVLYRQVEVTTITYDLNLPDHKSDSYPNETHHWDAETPYISVDSTDVGTSYTQTVYYSSDGTYEYDILKTIGGLDEKNQAVYVANNQDNIRGFLKSQGESYGKVYQFDGWILTGADNKELGVFSINAALSLNPNTGEWKITDSNGTSMTISGDVTLKGNWTLISDVIAFYINAEATVMDTDNDIGNRNTDDFAGAVALGHVYYVDKDYSFAVAGASGDTYRVIDKKIDDYIVLEKTDEFCILLEYLAVAIQDVEPSYMDGTGFTWSSSNIKQTYEYKSLSDCEVSTLEEAEKQMVAFLAEYSGLITSKDGGETPGDGITFRINNSEGTQKLTEEQLENAEPCWYVLKQQNDWMHCDGIIAIDSDTIEVTKTVYGLDDAQTTELLTDGDDSIKLTIPVELAKDGISTGSVFTSLTALTSVGMKSDDTYYTYDSQNITTEPYSESWTLTVAVGSEYIIDSEENKDAITGYVCNTIVVLTDEDGNTTAYYLNGTDSEKSLLKQWPADDTTATAAISWTSDDVKSIDIYNIYSPDEDWGFLVLKTDENGKALQGATFTLVSDDGEEYTGISDENGIIYFNNLKSGIAYTLTETDAPEGYALSDTVYSVSEPDDDSTLIVLSVLNDVEVEEEPEEPTTPTEDPTPEESETPTEDAASEETSNTVETETVAETVTTETVEPVTATATSAAETGDNAPLAICICVAAVCEFALLILIFQQMRNKKKEE